METNKNENVVIDEENKIVEETQSESGSTNEDCGAVETSTDEGGSGLAMAAGVLIAGIGAAAVIAGKKIFRKKKAGKASEDEEADTEEADEKPAVVKLTLKERLTGKSSRIEAETTEEKTETV